MNSSEPPNDEDYETSSSSEYTQASSETEDDQLSILWNLEILRTVMPDIEPMEEPTVPQHPDVVRIKYSDSFNYVMGLYRKMRPNFAGLSAASSPRWFFLIAFVLRHCTSHYTAWQDRRDVVFSAPRLLASTQECLFDLAHDDPSFKEVVAPVANVWLPKRDSIIGSNGECSAWRAVVWELGTIQSFCLACFKNFQVWHHRKECLLHALGQTEDATRTRALKSIDAFEELILAKQNIQFADIDERILCDRVLEEDSKNYHMWIHRSWFLHTFSFLVEPPSWSALLSDDFTREDADSLSPFRIAPHWREQSEQPALPPCALWAELAYTADVIRSDSLNNSAWCHRFLLFDRLLVAALLRDPSAASLSVSLSLSAFAAAAAGAVERLCRAEMHFALQWCAHDPANETPFVHARSVAAVHQAAAMRLLLADEMEKVKEEKEEEEEEEEDEEESLLMCQRSQALAPLAERVPWETYLRTFELLRLHLHVLWEAVVPRAEDMRSRTSRKDAKALRAVYRCRSQFLIDNIHQVYAAIYHGIFTFLNYTWCHYFTDNDRACVHAALPSEAYDEGLDAVNGRIKGAGEKDSVSLFLTYEVEAAHLAKKLVYDDEIRSKYWKNEIKILIHREYA